jgi:hypothetical protein
VLALEPLPELVLEGAVAEPRGELSTDELALPTRLLELRLEPELEL